MFNKGQFIGHIKPSIDHMPQTSINSLTTQKMIDEHVQPDTFTPPLHTQNMSHRGHIGTQATLGPFTAGFPQTLWYKTNYEIE